MRSRSQVWQVLVSGHKVESQVWQVLVSGHEVEVSSNSHVLIVLKVVYTKHDFHCSEHFVVALV